MISKSLYELSIDENFAFPYGKNHSSDDVLSLQPVEKVMFVYKLLAALDSMSVSVRKDPCRILRSVMTAGMMETKPVSPLRIDYTAATAPITLSFE